MPLLTRLFPSARRSLENPSTPLSAGEDWMYEALGAVKASSGVNVNRETALTYAAWWRGVNLVSRDIAKLPVHVYKRGAEGKQRDTQHSAYYLLRRQPNREMTPFHFRQTMMGHVLAEGNGYAYIDRATDGTPLELIPLQPYRTYPVRANGRLWYITELTSGAERKIPAENILHIKGLSFDGLVGYSVIRKARESLGLGMALDTFGSTIFRNGTTKRVVLKHPGRLSPQAQTTLRESWERMHVGLENAHKTAILAEGMEAQEFGISARDAQLLDERKFQIREIALWFGIPPHKLGDMESASYNSLEQENQAYLDSAIDPWLVNWEQECDCKLLTEYQRRRDTHLVEFNRKALVRGDMGQRTAYYQALISCGVLNRDEAREDEGYNPIPGGAGAAYLIPLNMGPADGQPPKPGEPTGDKPQPPAAQQKPATLLDLPDVRQQHPYDCGASATMSVCQYFGVGPATEEEYIAALGTTPEAGTKPSAILDFLARQGLVATAASDLDLDDLRAFWTAGHPVICPIQDYGDPEGDAADVDGHYVVVIGCSLGYVFLQDPSADNALDGSGSDAAPGRVMIPEDKFLSLWHDTDADGSPYKQFGIAVGKELLTETADTAEGLDTADDIAEGAPGEKINPTKQKPIAGDDSNRLSGDSPARKFLDDVYHRMSKRIGLKARRYAKDPKAFMAWLDRMPGENAEAVRAAFAPAPDGQARADYFLAFTRDSLLELSGRCTAKNLAAEVDRYMTEQERCGGPGSGVPGPCPDKGSGDKEGDKKEPAKDDKADTEKKKAEALDKAVKELEKTPEGKAAVEKGATAAAKAKTLISNGVKSALDALDKESKGGISLIAGGLANKSPKTVAAGVAHLFDSVYQSVHQEVYENALSQHNFPMTHKAGMIAASIAVKAEKGVIAGAAWAWNKATGKQKKSFRCAMKRDDLTDADKQLLDALAAVAAQALKDVYSKAGVELKDEDLDMDVIKATILEHLQESKDAEPKE